MNAPYRTNAFDQADADLDTLRKAVEVIERNELEVRCNGHDLGICFSCDTNTLRNIVASAIANLQDKQRTKK